MNRTSFVLWFIFSSIVLVSIIIFWPRIQNSFVHSKKSLVTPVTVMGKTLGLNQWFPKEGLNEQLNITAKSAFFIDTKTGQVLFQKNPKERLPIASLVKIMTTLIALEHRGLDESFVVSERASGMEPDKMW